MSDKRQFESFNITNKHQFQHNMLCWAADVSPVQCLLKSNDYKNDKFAKHECLFAVGVQEYVCINNNKENAFGILKSFSDANSDWLFGFLSYDLKNQVEKLSSNNPDRIKMPLLYFFRPELLFIFSQNSVQIGIINNSKYIHKNVFKAIEKYNKKEVPLKPEPIIKSKVDRSKYIKNAEKIKDHIQKGDIYEMNYCIEFYAENAKIDPVFCYESLNLISPSPFSAFLKYDNKYLICSSPERFIKKDNNTIISQPIKGTAPRGSSPLEDETIANDLYNDKKERSENVMIVDLVRNDLSKTARKNSVIVEELFGIYKFAKVHQMISTIKSELKSGCHYIDVIKEAFPMGSMTGAPKIKAMELAEKYENTKRGLYSGSIGYITPDKNFDFNVVIRSILYSEKEKYLSFMAGSAITIGSDSAKEYSECLLKAQTMASVFKQLL